MSKKFSCQIRQILLYIAVMKIPLFKNDKELAAFVDKLRPEEIRAFATADWNRLYTQIDKLCSKLNRFQQWKNRFNGWRQNFIRLTGGKKALKFYNPQTDFLKKHQSIFIKLNKNYRPETAHRAKVKEAAARLAATAANHEKNPRHAVRRTLFPKKIPSRFQTFSDFF